MNRSADPNSDKMRAEFRQKLENYQAAPSENLWDKIELSLEKEEALVYKNRFRVYSRLAAACLLLLLAFGAFFIPNKLKQIQGESAEFANIQNEETKGNKNLEILQPEAPVPASSAIASAGKTPHNIAENGSHFEEKTAAKASENNPNRPRQIAFNAAITGNTSASGKRFSENTAEEKTVAFQAQKVKPQHAETTKPETITEVQENGMVAAAKTAITKTTASETIAAAGPDIAAVSPARTIAPETEKPAHTETPAIAAESKKAAPTKIAANASGTKPETAIAATSGNESTAHQASAIEETNTFSAKNATVSEASESRKGFSLFSFKSSRLKTAGSKPLLPDSITLAVLPETEEQTEKVKNKTKTSPNGRWQVAMAYGGGTFHAGMRLANQARIQQSGNIVPPPQIQAQNLAQYEEAIREFNENISPAYSQALSFLTAFKISENWLVQSGLKFVRNQSRSRSHYAFSRRGGIGNTNYDPENLQNAQPVFEVALNNSFDPASTVIHETETRETTYRFQQIGAPVNLRFQTHGKTIYYFAGAGFTIYRTREAKVTENGEETSYPVLDSGTNYSYMSAAPPMVFRKWLPAWGLQTGIGYKLTHHWQLEMALEGEQYMKPLFQDEHEAGARQQKPKTLSGSFKVAYSF